MCWAWSTRDLRLVLRLYSWSEPLLSISMSIHQINHLFSIPSGGGPSGACAAEIFAQEPNIETIMFERKFDNAKPCGGAIPLCMIGECGDWMGWDGRFVVTLIGQSR